MFGREPHVLTRLSHLTKYFGLRPTNGTRPNAADFSMDVSCTLAQFQSHPRPSFSSPTQIRYAVILLNAVTVPQRINVRNEGKLV